MSVVHRLRRFEQISSYVTNVFFVVVKNRLRIKDSISDSINSSNRMPFFAYRNGAAAVAVANPGFKVPRLSPVNWNE